MLPLSPGEHQASAQRTGIKHGVARHCAASIALEPTGPTMRGWSARTELNCHHELAATRDALRYTTPRLVENWCAR